MEQKLKNLLRTTDYPNCEAEILHGLPPYKEFLIYNNRRGGQSPNSYSYYSINRVRDLIFLNYN